MLLNLEELRGRDLNQRRSPLASWLLLIALLLPAVLALTGTSRLAEEPHFKLEGLGKYDALAARTFAARKRHKASGRPNLQSRTIPSFAPIGRRVGKTVPMREGAARRDTVHLPAPVAETRRRLIEAAREEDYDTLAKLAQGEKRETPFKYSFGPPFENGPVGYWKWLQKEGRRPLKDLIFILQQKPTARGNVYIWPSWFGTPTEELTTADKRGIAELMGKDGYGAAIRRGYGYIGVRTKIREDGQWMYYLGGD